MKRASLLLAVFLFAFSAQRCIAQISEWEPMNRGIKHLLVYTIEIDPVDSLVMYCGTEYGNLYKSTDGGFNWELRTDGIPSNYTKELVTALFIDKSNTNLIYAGFGGRESKQNLFVSEDAAKTWSVITTPASWQNGGILSFYKSQGTNPMIYCGLGWNRGIYTSDDFGSTWSNTLTNYGVQVVTGHPLESDRLYCGTSKTSDLFYSTDKGKQWNSVRIQGQNVGAGIRAIALSYSNPNVIYIGETGNEARLYKSTDKGLNWVRTNEIPEISEIAIHPKNENIVYISTVHDGVFRTTDGGNSWTQLNLGLPKDPIMRVRIAPGYPLRVFVVTLKHGILRLVDEEIPPQ